MCGTSAAFSSHSHCGRCAGVIGAGKGQGKGKATQLCSNSPWATAEMLCIPGVPLATAPPAAAGMRGAEIGSRNELMPWEIWLLSLDSNQEPSG